MLLLCNTTSSFAAYTRKELKKSLNLAKPNGVNLHTNPTAMRSFIICFFLVFCVFANVSSAQDGQLIWTAKEIQKKAYRPLINEITYQCFGPTDTTWIFPPSKKNYIAPNFYTQHMGAVCKVELKMQKQIKFPLVIRMGSKDYVDRMEGKFLPQR